MEGMGVFSVELMGMFSGLDGFHAMYAIFTREDPIYSPKTSPISGRSPPNTRGVGALSNSQGLAVMSSASVSDFVPRSSKETN